MLTRMEQQQEETWWEGIFSLTLNKPCMVKKCSPKQQQKYTVIKKTHKFSETHCAAIYSRLPPPHISVYCLARHPGSLLSHKSAYPYHHIQKEIKIKNAIVAF